MSKRTFKRKPLETDEEVYLRAAASSLIGRHPDGSLPLEDFNIELEDQNEEQIRFGTETNLWAMMMGLMLHANPKKLIKRQLYKDAPEDLTMGEESFSLCNPKVIELQVSDEALSLVMSMSFKEHDAKRALRISSQDVGSAIDFLVEEKAKKAQQRQDNIR